MTKAEAINILIDHATKNVGGVGCGMRPEISHSERLKVATAIKKVWKMTGYHFEPSWHNMGLPDPDVDRINDILSKEKTYVNCPHCGVELPLRLDRKIPVHSHGKQTISPVDRSHCEGSKVLV